MINAIAWTALAEIGEGSVPVGTITIGDLLANQDYDIPDDFALEHWEKLVNEWSEAFEE